MQRHVLYLGEINDSQRAAWRKTIAVFDRRRGSRGRSRSFPRTGRGRLGTVPQVQLRLSALSLRRPRQWGACWLARALWGAAGTR